MVPDQLTCLDVFRRLYDYLDRELGRDETRLVEQHLALCATCAAEYGFEKQLAETLTAKLRRVDLPAALRLRIAGLLRAGALLAPDGGSH